MRHLTIVISLIIISNLSATIINIPEDQTTIQEGINVAVDGDTVLVQPGIYLENINFEGKEISVASLFLTTQDTTYISQTVIDGNQSGNVVRFEHYENNNSVLTGFILTNGLSEDQGGGIHCNYSSPILDHLIIINNVSGISGGGIYCNYAFPIISDTEISNNYSESYGGGIDCYYSSPTILNTQISSNTNYVNHGAGISCRHDSSPILNNVIISNNSNTSHGGGIYCIYNCNPILQNVIISNNSTRFSGGGLHFQYDSHPILENVLITRNFSDDKGGGIYSSGEIDLSDVTICYNTAYEGGGMYIYSNTINFDPVNRCNIYCNNAYFGSDLYNNDNDPVEVIVDTFTVQNPNNIQAYPIEEFTFDIMNAYFPQVNANLYVSPNGDDTNDGLSWDNPLKTIFCALSRIQSSEPEPHSIYLSSDTFSLEANGEVFPLSLISNISLIGDEQNDTHICGTGNRNILRLFEIENVSIENLTISNGKQGIYIENCTNINLETLSIKENFTDDSQGYGGGIHCDSSDYIEFNNLIIHDNYSKRGGGIYFCGIPNSNLNNCIIRNNDADNSGGGIYAVAGNYNLNNVKIFENTNIGLFCKYNAQLYLDNVSIYNNEGGIYCLNDGVTLNFSENHTCSIYNNHSTLGNDIYLYNVEPIEIIVDTFTVLNPTDLQAYPIEEYSFDILNSVYEQVNADLYVSPGGNNSNTGLNPDNPLKTIFCAFNKVLTDSLNPHTIFLDEGTYSAEANEQYFPVSFCVDYLTLQGSENNLSVLDGNNESGLLYSKFSNNSNINNLILQNGKRAMTFRNSIISISNVKCFNSFASYAGSVMYSSSSNLKINKSCFFNNSSNNHDGVFHINGGSVKLLNSTITDNDSGVAIYAGCELIIVNSIIREDYAYQINLEFGSAIITHSNILNGEDGINQYQSELHWLDGNIDEDPLFGWNYYLPEDSPCIDTGTAYFEWDNEIILDLAPENYYGVAPDMGAYEYGFVYSDDSIEIPTQKIHLSQNHPNPFNPSTIISFSIPNESKVELTIYNIKGQKIRTLAHNVFDKGDYSIIWNGDDESNKPVSSGIYLYKLNINGKKEAVKKCLLLK